MSADDDLIVSDRHWRVIYEERLADLRRARAALDKLAVGIASIANFAERHHPGVCSVHEEILRGWVKLARMEEVPNAPPTKM